MAHGPRYRVARRRRREGKTDYRKRINLIKSGEPRAVVRRSARSISVQFVKYNPKGDEVIVCANGLELEKFGWNKSAANTQAAYLTGYLAGKRAKSVGVESAVLDIGLYSPTRGSKIFASLKGLIDAGVNVPHNENILPTQERITGVQKGEEVKSQFETVLTSLEGEK
jgi:large subunit ribosomal protein L18